ncbi:hypothetical protein [Actinoplanes sp. HUAS TT8]|uniref:hypothetical protein n=1 Tax=Actinoplanes sp. HUAS TT8 TaxID=3447453 RepID=UPI003F51CF07
MPDDPHKFNTGDYAQRVLRRSLNAPSRTLLHVRYDLDPRWATGTVSGATVLDRVKNVVSYWERAAEDNTTTGISAVCRNWLQADADLRDRLGRNYDDPQWWLRQIPATPAADSDGKPDPDSAPVAAETSADPAAPATTALCPEVVVSQTRAGVHLRWSVPGVGSQRARFTVERGDASDEPRVVLVTDLEADGILDARAPTARLLWYYVTARTSDSEGAAEPRPAWFAPPVQDVTLDVVGVNTVESRWIAHPSATGFRVRRTVGRESADSEDGLLLPSSDGRPAFLDDRAPEGQVHYRITPVYRNADTGREAEGEPVQLSIKVTPPPPVPVIADHSISEHQGRTELTPRVTGVTGPDRILLIRARGPGTPAPGTTVPTRRVTDHGDSLTPRNDAGTLRFPLPAGRSTVVPVTIRGSLARFGAGVEITAVPEVCEADLERFGEKLLLRWRWPDGIRLARVTWITDGKATTWDVTDVELQKAGHIEYNSHRPTTVEIVSVLRTHDCPDLMSETVRRSAGDAVTELLYGVVHKRATLFQPRRMLFRFTATQACQGLDIEIRLRRPGAPPEQATLLRRVTGVGCGPETPWEIVLPTPARDDSLVGKRLIHCRAWHEGREIPVDNFNASDRGVD